MTEVLVRYETVLRTDDGRSFIPRACGRKMDDNRRWEGWIEFESPLTGQLVRTMQETVQPSREALLYWATGLTATYLEGAVERALEPPTAKPPENKDTPAFDGPRPRPTTGEHAAPATRAILDPFEVRLQGEEVLMRELLALDTMHLRNIALAHGLADRSRVLDQTGDRASLAELIVREVRERQESARNA